MNILNRELFIDKNVKEFFSSFLLNSKDLYPFSVKGLGSKKLVIYNENYEL